MLLKKLMYLFAKEIAVSGMKYEKKKANVKLFKKCEYMISMSAFIMYKMLAVKFHSHGNKKLFHSKSIRQCY